MIIITATKARNNLYSLIDETNASHEPIHIKGKRGSAILVSEQDWRSIKETLYLHSIPGMVASIQEARRDGIKRGSTNLDW